MSVPIVQVKVGDVVRHKKGHPCGGDEWEVTRIGMDIGLRCLRCDRSVRLLRYDFDRRFKAFVSRQAPEPPEHGG